MAGPNDHENRTVFMPRQPASAVPRAAEPSRPSRPDRTAAPAPISPATPRVVAVRRHPLRIAVPVVLGLWASAATGYAVWFHRIAEERAETQIEERLAYEGKVKALTRRLVGVASHGLLEQDGLTGRLADIIARQVELENRQSTLMLLGDRLGGSPAEASATRSRAPDPASASPVSPGLRLGAPGVTPEPDKALGRRSSREEPLSGLRAGRQKAEMALSGLPLAGWPLRDQFSAIEGSMNRLDRHQLQTLSLFDGTIRTEIDGAKAALTEVAFPLPGGTAPVRPQAPARRVGTDAFEAGLVVLEAEFGERARWRDLVQSVPFRVPLEGGGLTSNFGTRRDPFTGAATTHAGMDFRGPVGTPVRAPAIGRVITAGPTGGYGNLVEIDHGHDLVTRYGHLSAFAVTVGQRVEVGTIVGLVGSTGRSTGPHLHYETRIAGEAVDPARYLRAGANLFGRPPEPVRAPDDASIEDAAED